VQAVVILPSEVLESCETVITAFVSRPSQCNGGNEDHDIFGRKLDNGDGRERPREAGSGAPLAHREGTQLSAELLDRGAWPSRGFLFT
jgi:hypothetical protein